MDYRGARFYDSEVGRFLSLDVMAAQYPGWSQYNYVIGNPIFFIDKDGKAPDGWLDNVVGTTSAFTKGVVAAVVDNGFLGLSDAREDMSKSVRAENATAYNRGQDVGDVISMIAGSAEAYTGGTGAVGTVVAAPETGGASLVLTPEAVAVAVHGVGVVHSGGASLITQKGRMNVHEMSKQKTNSPQKTKHTDNRHVDRKKYPDKSKYLKPNQVNKLNDRTINNPDKVTPQKRNRTLYQKDFNRKIGTRDETINRVVVEKKPGNQPDKTVTSFPSKEFKQ